VRLGQVAAAHKQGEASDEDIEGQGGVGLFATRQQHGGARQRACRGWQDEGKGRGKAERSTPQTVQAEAEPT
jgi:hypothetical protein